MSKRQLTEYLEEVRELLKDNESCFRIENKKLCLSNSKSNLVFTFLPLKDYMVEVTCHKLSHTVPSCQVLLNCVIPFDKDTYQYVHKTYNQFFERYQQMENYSRIRQLADLLISFSSK